MFRFANRWFIVNENKEPLYWDDSVLYFKEKKSAERFLNSLRNSEFYMEALCGSSVEIVSELDWSLREGEDYLDATNLRYHIEKDSDLESLIEINEEKSDKKHKWVVEDDLLVCGNCKAIAPYDAWGEANATPFCPYCGLEKMLTLGEIIF